MTESPSLKYSSKGWEDKENKIYTESNHISFDPAAFLKRSLDDDYFRGFPITAEEKESIYAWQKEHLIMHEMPDISFRYEFIPTGVGTIGRCCCPVCIDKANQTAKEIVNPNDFDSDKKYQDMLKNKIEKLMKKYKAKLTFQDIDLF